MAASFLQSSLAFNHNLLPNRYSCIRLYAASPKGDPEKSNEGFFSFLKKSNERTQNSSAAAAPPAPLAKKNILSSSRQPRTPDTSSASKEGSAENLDGASSDSSAPGSSAQAIKVVLLLGACGAAAVPGVLPPGAGNYAASIVAMASVVAFHEAGHLVAALSQVGDLQFFWTTFFFRACIPEAISCLKVFTCFSQVFPCTNRASKSTAILLGLALLYSARKGLEA